MWVSIRPKWHPAWEHRVYGYNALVSIYTESVTHWPLCHGSPETLCAEFKIDILNATGVVQYLSFCRSIAACYAMCWLYDFFKHTMCTISFLSLWQHLENCLESITSSSSQYDIFIYRKQIWPGPSVCPLFVKVKLADVSLFFLYSLISLLYSG